MPSLLPGYQYDIFLSYRHNDNRSGWVTEFVAALQEELASTLKDPVSVYFDTNPHDGLLESHSVDKSLERKLKCLILIPVISQTYCDPKSFAWQHEFCAFNRMVREDAFGNDVRLPNGNVTSRILPIKIHDVDAGDKALIEGEIGGVLRAIDFTYKEAGVNRPLRASEENPGKNQNQILYRNQVNKVANAIKDIIGGLQGSGESVSAANGSVVERGSTPTTRVLKPKRKWRFKFPEVNSPFSFAFGVIAFLAFIAIAILYFSQPTSNNATYRATILPPEKTSFTTTEGGIALSPDGRSLAFVATDSSGNKLLWVRALQALKCQAIAGTEGASYPFWSPDSQFIGFFAGGKLKKITASGGPPQTICDASRGRGGSWSTNGTIIFCPSGGQASLMRVPASGGLPIALTKLDTARSETSHRWPYFLPDGEHFLYLARTVVGTVVEEDAVMLGSLDTTFLPRAVANSGLSASFANGHLMFIHEQTLMAQPFDLDLLETAGEAVPVAEEVHIEALNGKASFSASQNGVLVYMVGKSDQQQTLRWYDRTGKQLSTIDHNGSLFDLNLSPDGENIAASISSARDGNMDTWLYQVDRAVWKRFTFGSGIDRYPVWSPDGGKIVYSGRMNRGGLLLRSSTGEGSEELLLQSNLDHRPSDWSPDGKFIAYQVAFSTAGAEWDIWILPLEGDRKPYLFLQTAFRDLRPQFSPDGRYIAYESDESGQAEIYIRPFPGPGGKWQVSTNGGTRPRWRDDGKELFYLWQDRMMAAEIRLGSSSVDVGAVKTLFQHNGDLSLNNEPYDVTGDGQRFIIISSKSSSPTPATLVVNWVGEIEKK